MLMDLNQCAGFIFFFPTYLAGPAFEYNDYMNWMSEIRVAPLTVHLRNFFVVVVCFVCIMIAWLEARQQCFIRLVGVGCWLLRVAAIPCGSDRLVRLLPGRFVGYALPAHVFSDHALPLPFRKTVSALVLVTHWF